ncbi:hypothetical protein RYX36_027590 [Vicia faba]
MYSKKMPPKKNATQQKPRRTKYIIEEVFYSDFFIPMPQSSQVANPRPHSTPPPMHSTPPMSGYLTGLLSTPLGCTPFPPISPTTFISPTG